MHQGYFTQHADQPLWDVQATPHGQFAFIVGGCSSNLGPRPWLLLGGGAFYKIRSVSSYKAILSCIRYKQSIISSATNGSSLLAWNPLVPY